MPDFDSETAVLYVQVRLEAFFRGLSEADWETLRKMQILPEKNLKGQIDAFATRRPGEDEAEVFVGYQTNRGPTAAVYLTDRLTDPLMFLNRANLEKRIKNYKDQNLPCEQSEYALAHWPE